MISALPERRGGDASVNNPPPAIMGGPDKPGHDGVGEDAGGVRKPPIHQSIALNRLPTARFDAIPKLMETAADMHERHARLLGRLAELGMALAEDLHARALSADTPQEAETLASGFHKLSRSVRQSLALEVRLRRDAERVRREEVTQAETDAAKPAIRRRAEAKARLDRLIWTEAEYDDTARFWDEGARRLLADADFTAPNQPVEALVNDLAEILRARPPRPEAGEEPERVKIIWTIVNPGEEEPPDTG